MAVIRRGCPLALSGAQGSAPWSGCSVSRELHGGIPSSPPVWVAERPFSIGTSFLSPSAAPGHMGLPALRGVLQLLSSFSPFPQVTPREGAWHAFAQLTQAPNPSLCETTVSAVAAWEMVVCRPSPSFDEGRCLMWHL